MTQARTLSTTASPPALSLKPRGTPEPWIWPVPEPQRPLPPVCWPWA